MAEIFYSDGQWYDDNPALVGPGDHVLWMASAVFDGARAFDGCVPDLDLHCRRLLASAKMLGLESPLTASEVEDVCRQGVKRLPGDEAYYIKIVLYPTEGLVVPDPESTKFALNIFPIPFSDNLEFSAMLSSFRRPAAEMAPSEAKASCLYPNVARMSREARDAGYDNAVVLDPDGNVAEFASANLFMVKDGAVTTPKLNGTFLNGITRQRVMALLRDDGTEVSETTFSYEQLLSADEVFSTGNLHKVTPCTKIDDKTFEIGPVYKRARELYFEFAKTQPL